MLKIYENHLMKLYNWKIFWFTFSHHSVDAAYWSRCT